MMTFTSCGKARNFWRKQLLTFTIIRNTRWLIQNLHIGTLLLFHLITQIFHHFLLKALLINSFNSLQSSKFSSKPNFSMFTQKSFAESVLKSNHSLFPLGTTSTQNSCFSPSAHKSSVTSAPVKIVSSFSSNSNNSLVSRACLAICKANSNPKSNLVLKDHSKFHILPVSVFTSFSILPVSVKPAIPSVKPAIFVFPPHFQILVMLWFKNPVLILSHLILVLSQIQLHNVLFVITFFLSEFF